MTKPTRLNRNYITIKKLNIGPVPTMEILLQNCDPTQRLNQIIYRAYAAAINMFDGNQTKAAEYLGVAVSSMHNFVHGKKGFRYYRQQKQLTAGNVTIFDVIRP